ncbi:MAG: SDR family NAD(P)-dependent oxidoreductase, partial [Halofilum sp. (in: g-proteobacteria)]
MTLEGNVALVTGASRGIGQAIAQELGARGATLVGTATTDEGAKAITQAFEQAGIRGEGRALDVTDSAAVDTLVQSIAADHGAVTILVNNAGITRDNLLMRMSEDDWSAVLDTNLSSVYRVSKACLRGMMKARGGRIINIASVVGDTGNPGQTNYAAAKAGINAFTRSLAREV